MFWPSFFDKYWNFNNDSFNKLLKDSRKSLSNPKSKNNINKNMDIVLFESVNKKELWWFINKLSIFVNSGIDVKWALWILAKQTKNPFMKRVTIEMRNNIDYWITLSETMKQYPQIFDNLTTALIWVWEKTWTLWKILKELDTSMIESLEIKWKVKSAMIYPIILIVITMLMVTIMMIVVVPNIVEWYSKVWADLPGITRMVIAISDFMVDSWYLMLAYVTSFFIWIRMIKNTYLWWIWFAHLAIHTPLIKFLVRQSNIVYFINAFTLLLNSWVLLLESLGTASGVMTNVLYKKEVIRIKNEIESGLSMSKSLWLNTNYEDAVYLNKYFPEDFAYVVNTWEETWTLAESLRKIGQNYNSELKRFIANFSTLLEPFIIVLIWWIVGTIILAIMLPMFQMAELAKQM